MSLADLNSLYATAAAAMDAGDWDAAISALMKMQVRLAATPNLARSLAGGGNQSIGWNPGDLNSLIAQCRKQQTAARFSAGGLTQTRIVYSRPTG